MVIVLEWVKLHDIYHTLKELFSMYLCYDIKVYEQISCGEKEIASLFSSSSCKFTEVSWSSFLRNLSTGSFLSTRDIKANYDVTYTENHALYYQVSMTTRINPITCQSVIHSP